MSLDMYKDSSFLKVLSEPNSSKLLIPNEFVRKYGEMLPEEEAFLMTEEVFGRCWRVKITPLENGAGFCFGNGWPEFVLDNPQISALDVAIIKLVNASTFHVSIFGQDGLKKPSSSSSSTPAVASTPPPHPQDGVNKKRRRGKRPVDCSSSRRPPSIPQDDNRRGKNPIDCTQGQTSESEREGEMKSFTTVLAARHLYSMDIPREFGVKNGIIGKGRNIIMLENEKGDRWEVKVLTRKTDGRIWFRIDDWKKYRESNSLVVGNELTFSFVGHDDDDDFATLHVAREGFCAPSEKKRGRPSSAAQLRF